MVADGDKRWRGETGNGLGARLPSLPYFSSCFFGSRQTCPRREVHMRSARRMRELRRHCRRWRPLQNVHYVHTHSHTHTHTHTGDVTKRCDCPGRITRGRAHSAGERDMNTRAHARTHDTCTMHTAGFLLFLSPFCFVGPQRTWNFQGAPPLPLSPADDAPYSRQSPAGGVRVLSVPGRS